MQEQITWIATKAIREETLTGKHYETSCRINLRDISFIEIVADAHGDEVPDLCDVTLNSGNIIRVMENIWFIDESLKAAGHVLLIKVKDTDDNSDSN